MKPVDKARAGKGPTLLEFTTYRWLEHCGPNYDNDIGYRTEAEFLEWKARDPLPRHENQLVRDGVATAAELDDMMTAADAEIEAAYAAAKRALVILTEIWAERLAGTGVVAHSMHPGWAATPGVETSLPRSAGGSPTSPSSRAMRSSSTGTRRPRRLRC